MTTFYYWGRIDRIVTVASQSMRLRLRSAGCIRRNRYVVGVPDEVWGARRS